MVTIKEIAKYCDVSIATVSNILNGKPNASEETKRRVLKAIEELNYTPNYVAKNLKTRRTKTIGVIVEDITIFCAPEIIDGITKCCEERGYHILLTNLRLYKKFGDSYYTGDKFFTIINKEIKELISKQVDGIVYVTAHERILRCFPDKMTVPASMAYGYTKSDRYPSVVVDDKSGAYDIVNYAISMGHTNIGVIAGKENSIHTHDRLLGYQKALYDHKLFFNPDIIVEGDWTRASGYDNTDYLLSQNVTAIFCMNDIMAGGVYDRLEEKGMVPGEDISVMGFDNRELSNFYKPPLTTIELPLYAIGYTACMDVIQQIEIEQGELDKTEAAAVKRGSNKPESAGEVSGKNGTLGSNSAGEVSGKNGTSGGNGDGLSRVIEVSEKGTLLKRESVKNIL